jgi:MazG family protein
MSQSDRDPMTRLLQIMAALRDPEHGCPWDLKQDFGSLVPYTIEEAYEVADAIEHGDLDELRGELGDLLFQVVFYARLAEEQGAFGFAEVAEGISDKMERRHPHVFAGARAGSDAELRAAWERQKQAERQAEGNAESRLDGIARALPALVRADKLQRRAARAGFDWPDPGGAHDKCLEEIAEVEAAAAGGDPAALEAELGDLLFAVVNLVRLHGFDAEHALRGANAKFERRFRAMERRSTAAGQRLEDLSLAQLDAGWDAVKRDEGSGA